MRKTYFGKIFLLCLVIFLVGCSGEKKENQGDTHSPTQSPSYSYKTFDEADEKNEKPIAPTPSDMVKNEEEKFPGFRETETVDASSPDAVSLAAMEILVTWDTSKDDTPAAAAERAKGLISNEALHRVTGGPGEWSPLWWRQAKDVGAWSSAQAEVVPANVHHPAPDGITWVGIKVTWEWHSPQGVLVPDGGTRTCTTAVQNKNGKNIVVGFDCQDQES